jgi:hypothetical protein
MKFITRINTKSEVVWYGHGDSHHTTKSTLTTSTTAANDSMKLVDDDEDQYSTNIGNSEEITSRDGGDIYNLHLLRLSIEDIVIQKHLGDGNYSSVYQIHFAQVL